MELGLHDVLVENAKQRDNALDLFLKFSWDRGRQSRAIHIRFSGVTTTSGIGSCLGDEIVNTEIFANADGSYEYSALLRNTEISVVFKTVAVDGEPIVYPTKRDRDALGGDQRARRIYWDYSGPRKLDQDFGSNP